MSKRTEGAGGAGPVPGRSRPDEEQACAREQQQLLAAERPEAPLPPALEQHLAQCPRCRSLRSQLALLDGVAREQQPELPQGFELALRRRLEAHAREQPATQRDEGTRAPTRHRRRLALAAAALVLVAAAALLWRATQRRDDGAAPSYHRLRLAIRSAADHPDALFSVELPDGVRALPGAAGLSRDGQRLRWRSAIHRGQNELDLPLLAARPRGEVLVQLRIGAQQWSRSISFDTRHPAAARSRAAAPLRLALLLHEAGATEPRGLR
jgi:hypothetical protein